MSQSKRDWLRTHGVQDNIDDAFADMKSSSCMSAVLEDFAVDIWNMAVEAAKEKADETDTDADPAKAIANLEVQP